MDEAGEKQVAGKQFLVGWSNIKLILSIPITLYFSLDQLGLCDLSNLFIFIIILTISPFCISSYLFVRVLGLTFSRTSLGLPGILPSRWLELPPKRLATVSDQVSEISLLSVVNIICHLSLSLYLSISLSLSLYKYIYIYIYIYVYQHIAKQSWTSRVLPQPSR